MVAGSIPAPFTIQFCSACAFVLGRSLPGIAADSTANSETSLPIPPRHARFRLKRQFLLKVSLLLVPLIVSGFERHRFWARTNLWLAPIHYAVAGEGVALLWNVRPERQRLVAMLLLGMLPVVSGVPAHTVPVDEDAFPPFGTPTRLKALQAFVEQVVPGIAFQRDAKRRPIAGCQFPAET